MKNNQMGLEKAYARVAIVKAIIRAERERAEAKPLDGRNIKLGIVGVGQTKDAALQEISQTFNDIELFLKHLHVTHLAAAFESTALSRMTTIIGEARNAIKKQRKNKSSWPQDLVRSKDSFGGLGDFSQILNMTADERVSFATIKSCRNDFSHAQFRSELPEIGVDDALSVLLYLINTII